MNWVTICVPWQKASPKKIEATDAIFDRLAEVKQEAQQDKTILRMSADAKAAVNIGDFSRGGKSRTMVKAADHDFKPDAKVTPYGILLPDHDRVYLYLTTSRVTSDFIADCFEACWQTIKAEFPEVQTLLLHQDNGPENHSRRTQFMARMAQWSDEAQLRILSTLS